MKLVAISFILVFEKTVYPINLSLFINKVELVEVSTCKVRSSVLNKVFNYFELFISQHFNKF